MSQDEFKVWNVPYNDRVGVFINDLRRCRGGRQTSDETELLDNWFNSKHLLEVYTKPSRLPKVNRHFEFRLISDSRVVAKGFIRYAFLNEAAEFTGRLLTDDDIFQKQLE
jgi:hypothetical protein